MIQRIQTIFLLLAAASFGALFMVPLATSDKPTAQYLADSVYDITDNIALTILTVLGAALAVVAIFLFKNRPLQLKLGYLLISLAVLLPLAAFLLFTNQAPMMDATVQVKDQAGVFLPGGAILFAALANYFIRKDDRLVKSMDRLR